MNNTDGEGLSDQKLAPFTGQPSRINEKPSSGSILPDHNRDSSSSVTGSDKYIAKVQNNTKIAKNRIKKFVNHDFVIDYSSVGSALSGLTKLFAMRNEGGSRYTVLRTEEGNTVAIRISDHKANGRNFAKDNADDNLSIVIERKNYDVPDSGIIYTEATIKEATFNEKPQEVVRAIVNGVSDVIAGKEFTLDKSIGEVESKGPKSKGVKFRGLFDAEDGIEFRQGDDEERFEGLSVGEKVLKIATMLSERNRDAMIA